MTRGTKREREIEADCWGGQGSPRAVAPIVMMWWSLSYACLNSTILVKRKERLQSSRYMTQCSFTITCSTEVLKQYFQKTPFTTSNTLSIFSILPMANHNLHTHIHKYPKSHIKLTLLVNSKRKIIQSIFTEKAALSSFVYTATGGSHSSLTGGMDTKLCLDTGAPCIL